MLAFGAERIDGDGSFVVGVLAPIDQDFSAAQGSGHVGDDAIGIRAGEKFGDRAGEGLGGVVGDRDVERRVNLNAFGARNFCETFEMEFCECFLEEKGDFGALENVRAFARIEIENEVRGCVDFWNAMEEGMKFKRGGIGSPGERGGVVDQYILNGRFIGIATGNWKRFDPIGREGREIFFVKGFAEDAVGKALQSDGTIAKMRENCGRNFNVIIDDVRFGEFASGIENFVRARNGDLLAADFDCGLGGHRVNTAQTSPVFPAGDVLNRKYMKSPVARGVATANLGGKGKPWKCKEPLV
jgi:hypothetical protein